MNANILRIYIVTRMASDDESDTLDRVLVVGESSTSRIPMPNDPDWDDCGLPLSRE